MLQQSSALVIHKSTSPRVSLPEGVKTVGIPEAMVSSKAFQIRKQTMVTKMKKSQKAGGQESFFLQTTNVIPGLSTTALDFKKHATSSFKKDSRIGAKKQQLLKEYLDQSMSSPMAKRRPSRKLDLGSIPIPGTLLGEQNPMITKRMQASSELALLSTSGQHTEDRATYYQQRASRIHSSMDSSLAVLMRKQKQANHSKIEDYSRFILSKEHVPSDSRQALRKEDFIEKYKQLNVFKKNRAEFGGITSTKKQTRNSDLAKPVAVQYSSLPTVEASKLPEHRASEIQSWENLDDPNELHHKHSRAFQSQMISGDGPSLLNNYSKLMKSTEEAISIQDNSKEEDDEDDRFFDLQPIHVKIEGKEESSEDQKNVKQEVDEPSQSIKKFRSRQRLSQVNMQIKSQEHSITSGGYLQTQTTGTQIKDQDVVDSYNSKPPQPGNGFMRKKSPTQRGITNMALTSSFKVTQLTEANNPMMAQTAFNSQHMAPAYIDDAKQSSGFRVQSSSTFAPSEEKKERNISPESQLAVLPSEIEEKFNLSTRLDRSFKRTTFSKLNKGSIPEISKMNETKYGASEQRLQSEMSIRSTKKNNVVVLQLNKLKDQLYKGEFEIENQVYRGGSTKKEKRQSSKSIQSSLPQAQSAYKDSEEKRLSAKELSSKKASLNQFKESFKQAESSGHFRRSSFSPRQSLKNNSSEWQQRTSNYSADSTVTEEESQAVIDEELWKEAEALQLKIDPQALKNLDKRFLVQAQQMDLYMRLLNQVNQLFLKKSSPDIFKFFDLVLERVRGIKETHLNQIIDLQNQYEFMKTDLHNLQSQNLTLNYQNMIYQSKDATYNQILEATRKDDKDFREKFGLAHEFLQGKSMKHLVEDLEKREHQDLNAQQADLHRKISQLMYDFQENPMNIPSGMQKMSPRQRIKHASQKGPTSMLSSDFLNFSGVTNSLDEVHTTLKKQIRPTHISSQVQFKDTAFLLFAQDLKKRVGRVQIKTGMQLWSYLKKDIQFSEIGIQCDEDGIKDKIYSEIQEIEKHLEQVDDANKKLRRENRALEEYKLKQNQKIAHQMSQMRGLNKESQDVRDQMTIMEHSLKELKREKQEAEENYRNLHDELNSKQRFINELQKKIKFKDDILKNHMDMQTVSPIKDDVSRTPSKREPPSRSLSSGSSLGGSSINQDLKFDDDAISQRQSGAKEGKRKSKFSRRSTVKGSKRKLLKKDSIMPDPLITTDDQPLRSRRGSGSVSSPKMGEGLQRKKSPGEESLLQVPRKDSAKTKRGFFKKTTSQFSVRSRKKPSLEKNQHLMETEAPNPGSIDEAMSYPSIDKGSEESFMRSKHAEFNPGDIKITATSPRHSHMNLKPISKKTSESQAPPKECRSACVQTEQEMLFDYILAFLRVLEDRINSGELEDQIVQQVPEMQGEKQGGSGPGSFPSTTAEQVRLYKEMLQTSRQKLKEIQHVLSRIGSLRNGKGGDVFFRGLAKTFSMNPVIPPSSYYQLFNLDLQSPLSKAQDTNNAIAKHFLMNQDGLQATGSQNSPRAGEDGGQMQSPTIMVPKFMVKTKLVTSVGGGMQSKHPFVKTMTSKEAPMKVHNRKFGAMSSPPKKRGSPPKHQISSSRKSHKFSSLSIVTKNNSDYMESQREGSDRMPN